MAKRTKLGVVTTGHGPRDEYIHYHQEILRSLGADVEVVIRHIYDGLALEDLLPHQVGKETPNLGSHVHVPGAVGNHMGDGWEHRFFALDFATGRVQAAIDSLERDDGVDMVLLACAAEFPEGSISAGTLLIHPRELMFSVVDNLARGSRRKVRIGVLVDAEHADHDYADWARRPFFERIELVMAPVVTTALAAAEELGRRHVEFAFFFGYGVGLAPYDPVDEIPRLQAAIGAPLLLPHRVTSLHLRNLIGPGLDDHAYLPQGWGLTS
ncbi:AroM family protein [Labrys monachus]|uniref:AroM protein n=1 Tax=Labrys monachus TaxID=217067 RepID=A0ABU0F780_9HYPH|nr:AroM family protein [Labrys monachus]MDQ0390477.1 hypothetical protein [Labrys monachus]